MFTRDFNEKQTFFLDFKWKVNPYSVEEESLKVGQNPVYFVKITWNLGTLFWKFCFQKPIKNQNLKNDV